MFFNWLGALPGAAAQGMVWGIMAIGVYLTYKILDVADLTVDGSICTGGAVCAVLVTSGVNVWIAMLAAMIAPPHCHYLRWLCSNAYSVCAGARYSSVIR